MISAFFHRQLRASCAILFLLPVIALVAAKPTPDHAQMGTKKQWRMAAHSNNCTEVFSKAWIESSLPIEEKVKRTKERLASCKMEEISPSDAAYKLLEQSAIPRFDNQGPSAYLALPSTFPSDLYVEVICETDPGSPTVKNLEVLTSTIQSNAATCAPVELYNRGACYGFVHAKEAATHTCGPKVRKEEKFYSSNETLFRNAELSMEHFHSGAHCWFRQTVLPMLVLKHCAASSEFYTPRAGGIVRVGKIINKSKTCKGDECKDLKNQKVVWVLDVVVFTDKRQLFAEPN